ncbi:HAD-IIIA family hydrolase [Pseudodesulfovibrio sp. zrk46]|uniref:HAD-IIIA family hydrolase n=1 Tax=Pseudodesulfovibrio sp. zrk46 TaxID=2725288 RepID=UPI001B3656A7|nr:HAD-IIIA family hydrolase [Pseudodesulfovibrio sp. zrk46]
MNRFQPKQAVILAGGQGSRLRPLTNVCPKPMVEFGNKPFLEHVIGQLQEQGITRVLLLLGYMAESVTSYFGDGSRFGVEIEYNVTPEEDDTGTRLRKAKEMVDDTFLFLYCDNYVPIRLDRMAEKFAATEDIKALVTVYDNKDGYTKNNLRIAEDGLIELYDKTRTAENLQGVDIGYMITKREVLDLIPESNCSFEKEVYPQLVDQKALYASVTGHRYYSVGDFRRMPLTTAFFSGNKAVLVDRDGVLNKKAPRGEYVAEWDQWEWLPGAREGLKLFHDAGYRIILITNQAGIARGMVTQEHLDLIHENMKREAGVPIEAIYCCPHHWDEDCDCRKPKPGMLYAAQREHHLNLAKTYFIGDDERDGIAADNAGARFYHIKGDRTLTDAALHVIYGDKSESDLFPNKKIYEFDVNRLRIDDYYAKVVADNEHSMELYAKFLKQDEDMACPLCGDENKSLFMEYKTYRLLSCAHCGLTYPNLDCEEAEDAINEWYTSESAAKDATLDTFDYRKHKLFVDRVQYFKRLIPNFGEEGYRVLDFGCGEGMFLSVLDMMGIANKGLDASADRHAYGEGEGFNIANTPVEEEPDNHYDMVALFDVLEHINKPAPLFEQFHRIMKPGGHMAIYIPNIHSVGWKMLGNRHHCLHPFFHNAFHSEQSLAYLASETGFRITKLDYYGLDVIDYLGFKSHEDGYDYNRKLAEIIPYLQAAIDSCDASSHLRIIMERMS